jgi:hypothetical protein
MNKASFKIVFAGPSVDNGEIDIQELASSFMAMAGVIQAANAQINGEQAKVSVKLQATEKGSVIVDLVIVQSIMAQAATLLDALSGHKDGISAAKDLADLIFKVGTLGVAATGGYFSLMKWLAGRKPDSIVTHGSEVHIHIGDNYFVTDQRVVALAENLPVREQTRKLVSVLCRDGIDKISTIQDDQEPLQIQKIDVPAFEIPEPDGKDEVLLDQEIEMHLQIDSLSFKEGNKWRMTDGGDPFYVVLDDAHFLALVNNGQVSFSKNDILHCRVNEKQLANVKGLLKKEYRILKVLEHRRGSTQLRLL